MSEELRGYLYRAAPLDEAAARALIAEHVFGGAQVFAFDADTTELALIAACPSPAAVPLAREWGQVFSRRAEIRWKRQGAGYDLLLLVETPLDAPGSFRQLASLDARPAPANAAVQLRGDMGGNVLHYIEYLGPGGAVQWLRSTGLTQGASR